MTYTEIIRNKNELGQVDNGRLTALEIKIEGRDRL